MELDEPLPKSIITMLVGSIASKKIIYPIIKIIYPIIMSYAGRWAMFKII